MSKRGAFTLIELIFSMVIIAIAFTVLPKMLQLAAKSSKQSLKEEGMYGAVALMGLIQSTAWDEKNTQYDDILLVNSGNNAYDCNTTTTYRAGGFVGSRNCKNAQNASTTLGMEVGETIPNDMDDFSSYNASNDNNDRNYTLNVSTIYVADPALSDTTFSTNPSTQSTNTKYIVIDVNTSSNKMKPVMGNSVAHFYYFASNIGQMQVKKRAW